MPYQVRLEVFEGPFDLLLHLIAKHKVDVTEVDLADITADFLASLTGIEELDLETATSFLVVAATLIELKALRLLPTEERGELEDALDSARDVLYARLLEYRAFREAAATLRELLAAGAGFLTREVPLPPALQRLVPDAPLPVDAAGLAALAAVACAPRPAPHVDVSHIRRSALSIREAARIVLDRLPPEEEEGARFADLAAGHGVSDRVVVFLALLELYKLGHLDLEQPDHRGSLRVSRRGGGRDLAALTDDELGAADGTDTTGESDLQPVTAAVASD